MSDLRPVPASLESRLQDLSPEKRALFELLMADDEAAKAKVRSVEPRHDRGFAPLSFAQERLWFLERLIPGTALFTLTSTWRVPETLDVATFERSVNEVVRRHESLRTTFAVRDGEPVQVIAPDRFLPVYSSDLAHLDPTAREAEATAIANQESLQCFELEHGPLLRATVVRLASDDHLVVVTMHHIISDGWSIGVFWNELSAIWRAYAAGQRSPLGDPGLQFGDVATWERESLRGEHLQTLLAYWRDQLRDLTALELPLDLPRPATPSGRGAATYLSIPAPLTAALRRLSHDAGTTLFMTLLAAFETLLHRYTGQDDVVVGTYAANRNRTEFEDVIGFFVNPLVLRADFTGSPTFRSLLAQVRRSTLGAYAHQELPFARLVQELSPDRDLSRNPLFQVAFQMLNAPQMGSATTPDDGEPEVAREAAVLDLTCTVWEVTSGIGVELEYNTDLFTRESVERLGRHFHQLLENLVSDPDRPLRTVSVLTPTERHRVVEEWNDTAVPCPTRPGLTDLFDAQVTLHPDRTAVIAGDEAVSFADLGRGVARLARRLTDLGVGPEVRVGVCLPRSPDLVTALLAVLRAGGVYVPLDPTHPKDRLAYMLADAAVEVLVTSTLTFPALPASTATVVVLDLDDHDAAVMDADPAAPPGPGSRGHRVRHLHLGIDRAAEGGSRPPRSDHQPPAMDVAGAPVRVGRGRLPEDVGELRGLAVGAPGSLAAGAADPRGRRRAGARPAGFRAGPPAPPGHPAVARAVAAPGAAAGPRLRAPAADAKVLGRQRRTAPPRPSRGVREPPSRRGPVQPVRDVGGVGCDLVQGQRHGGERAGVDRTTHREHSGVRARRPDATRARRFRR